MQNLQDVIDIMSSYRIKMIFLCLSWGALGCGFLTEAFELANIDKLLNTSTSNFLFLVFVRMYQNKIYFFAGLEVTTFTFYYIITSLHTFVFGQISDDEAQDMHNMCLSYLFFKFVMISCLLDTLFPECIIWATYFSVLLAGKSFNRLGLSRFKSLVAQGMIDSRVVKRQLIALVLNFVVVGIWSSVPYYLFFSEVGWHPIVMFILDGAQICVQSLIIIFNYFIYLYSIDEPETWPKRDSYTHGIQLIGVCAIELVHLMNLAYIWSFNFLAFSLLDLVLLQYLLGAYFKLTGAIREHQNYFNVIHEINNKYADADPADITPDCVCAICQEHITEGKQLPCRHIFHLKCLQDWMRYRHICPVCRMELTPDRNENENQQGTQIWGWSIEFPSFMTFRVTRHQMVNREANPAQLDEQVQQLLQMFPDEDEGQLRADLIRTRSLLEVADAIMSRQ